MYASISQPLDELIGTTHFRGRNLNLSAKPRLGGVKSMFLYDQDFAYRMHTQSTLLFKHLGLHVYAFIYQPLDKPIGTTHFRGQNLNLGAILRLVDVTSMYLYDRDFAYRMHTQSTLLFKHLDSWPT